MSNREIVPSQIVEVHYPPNFPNTFGAAYRHVLLAHPEWSGLDSETVISLSYQTSNALERQVLSLLATEAASREDAAWRAAKGRVPRMAEADMHVREEPKKAAEPRAPATYGPANASSPPNTIDAMEAVLENYISELGPASNFNFNAILALKAKVLDFRKACEWVVAQMHMGKPVSNPPGLVYTTLRRMMDRYA